MMTMRITCAAFAALLPALVAAQTQDPDKAELRRQIVQSLTTVLGGDSARVVVEKLGAVKVDGAISRNFDVVALSKLWFGPRTVPNPAPDCRTTQTAAGESDQSLCMLEVGRREADEKGNSPAYAMLAYSKNVGLGDIVFVKRPAGVAEPTPVKNLTDPAAYEQARKFIDQVGVPRSEVPTPPQGFLPVRSLAIGTPNDTGGGSTRMTIQKVVSFPRAFAVPGGFPWLKDPRSGQELGHVIAPGSAIVALNDAGVQFAGINDWSDAQMDPNLDPKAAKTVTELTDEITEDLYGEGVRKVGSLSILIALRKAYPNPDDPNPPLCPVCGLLLPAVQVTVAPVAVGRVDKSAIVAPGMLREYDLVKKGETAPPR